MPALPAVLWCASAAPPPARRAGARPAQVRLFGAPAEVPGAMLVRNLGPGLTSLAPRGFVVHTYFASNGVAVRIGRADNLPRRLAQLRHTYRNPNIRFLTTLDHDCADDMRALFARFRCANKWFAPPPAILEGLAGADAARIRELVA